MRALANSRLTLAIAKDTSLLQLSLWNRPLYASSVQCL